MDGADVELIEAAKNYVGVIERIERTSHHLKLRHLEHVRVDLHWDFIEMLKERGIPFRDRSHATEIAIQIARTQ